MTPEAQSNIPTNDALVELVIRLADDHLILGHRLSEWCGHAPMLEEDLSMPNIALDLIGQARALFSYAANCEGKGRTEDDLAFLRVEKDYHNLLLVERPNGDFGHTMMRQYLFSAFMVLYWEQTQSSKNETLAAVAGKALKESQYHARHTAEWVIRLGDGTSESHERMVAAFDALCPYIDEMFEIDSVAQQGIDAGIIPNVTNMRAAWNSEIETVFKQATLDSTYDILPQSGGRIGEHTEDLGFLLAQLQFMQRSYPNMSW